MSEIDPVILELRADLDRYRSEIKDITTHVQNKLGEQERAAQRLERQMQSSAGAIGDAFRDLATTLGALFTGRELVGMIDSFTRLQNSLKVAGIEGLALEQIQTRLLDLATRYGVSIESLADLFGKAAQSGKDLGASQAQILQLTEATSQALLITGTSSEQASGAILGLTQALASGIVRAEEFNQINEGGLRPLLQAAAATDKYGGSVSKLRLAVADGKVSSQEFYQAILSNASLLEGQAAKATLTLEGAFTALTSALTVYVGRSAEANGVTGAFAAAIKLLADNVDVIIPALATIVAIIGVRYAAALLAAGVRMVGLNAASLALAASLNGVGAAATLAGSRLLAVFGGPIGAAVTALTVAIGGLAYATRDTAASLEQLQATADGAEARLADAKEQARRAGVDIDNLKGSADGARASFLLLGDALSLAAGKMADITNNARSAALATINLENALARKTINELAPKVQVTDTIARRNRNLNAAFGDKVTGYEILTQAQRDQLEIDRARIAQAKALISSNAEAARVINSLPPGVYKEQGAGSGAVATADGKKPKKGRARSGRSGPTAEEIEDRFNAELASIAQQTLSARQSLATSADERAELELRSVELARQQALASLDAEKDYSEAQKARIRDALENLADFERERVERDRRLQLEQDRADLADAEYRAEADALRNQYDLATTDEDRRNIALRILEAEDAYLRSKLEAVIANQDLTEAVRRQAEIELAALNSSAGDRRRLVEKSNAGALDRYIESISDTKARTEEAMVRQLQDVNEGITDALTEQLGIKNRFVKDLFSIFLDEVIFRPLAEALRNQQGGSGIFSAIGTALGSFFGRASGGYVGPGQTVRVNEHRGGVEYLRMGSQGGTVIPLGQVNAMAARGNQGGGVVRVVVEEAPGFASKVAVISEDVSIRVTRQSAPAIVDASANEALRRAGRPKL